MYFKHFFKFLWTASWPKRKISSGNICVPQIAFAWEQKKQWRVPSSNTIAFSFTRPSAIRSLCTSNRLRLRKKNNGVFLHQKQWRFPSPGPARSDRCLPQIAFAWEKNKTIAFSFNRPSASGWPSGSGLVAGCSWIPRIANSGKRGIAKHQTWPKWHSRTILNNCCTILVEFVDKRLNGWRSAHTLKPTADRPSGQIYKEWTESAQSVHYTPVREHKTRKARAVNGHWALWKCNLLVCVGSLVPSFNRALPCSFVSVQAFCVRWCKLFWPTSGMSSQELKKKKPDRHF